MGKNRKEIIKISGIYMMLNIGAGFTSGQEILQFFSGFGWLGFLGGVITFIFMLYGGESLIDAGWLCRNDHKISVFEYFGGSVIGRFYNAVIPILLFGSYIIMIAGAGSVLEQFFNIPNVIGRFLVCTLSVVSIFFKFQYIAKYLSYIGRGIAAVIFVVSVVVILKGLGNIPSISSFIRDYPITVGSDSFYGAGILYSGTIVLASSQFLFDTGMNLEQRNSGFYGILGGAFGFVTVILTIHFAIILYLDKVYELPIVTLYFAEQISPSLAFVITLLIFIAMYSAGTVCLWSVSNVIRKKFDFWKTRYIIIIVLLGIGGLFLSSVPFGRLVNILYPVNGMFGIFLVLLIVYHNRRWGYRINHDE
ncbi:MAG: YkvI family membrane protein [Brevinema sp.]